MKLDPVLAEIRAVREAYAMRFSGDIKGMMTDIRNRQKQGSRKVVSRPPKRLTVIQEPADTDDGPGTPSAKK